MLKIDSYVIQSDEVVHFMLNFYIAGGVQRISQHCTKEKKRISQQEEKDMEEKGLKQGTVAERRAFLTSYHATAEIQKNIRRPNQ